MFFLGKTLQISIRSWRLTLRGWIDGGYIASLDIVWFSLKAKKLLKEGTIFPHSFMYICFWFLWLQYIIFFLGCDCLGVTNDAGNGADCSAGWCYMYNGLPLIETGLPGCDRFTHISIHESSNDKLNGLYIGYSYEICGKSQLFFFSLHLGFVVLAYRHARRGCCTRVVARYKTFSQLFWCYE